MKLVQVNHAFDPALPTPGALLDRYHTLTGWSDAAAGAGVSVSVVQVFSEDALLHRGAVDYLFCRPTRSGAGHLASAVCDAVGACAPDIVHVNGFDAPMLVRALRRTLPPRVPVLVQDHAGVRPPRMRYAPSFSRRALRSADAFLFTSRSQAAPWINAGVIAHESDVHVILEASTSLTPIDRAVARERTGISGSPAVLWVGRLDTNKDPLTVLAGFEGALDVMPGATLTMVFGSAALLDEVTRRVSSSRRLRDSVRLAGAVAHGEMAAWYSAADLFVLGSHHEGMGYALMEACKCGTVPVVSDIAPFLALTGEGAVGRHWPVGDANACAAALVAAFEGHEDGRRAVLHHFASNLSWDVVGRRARAIYEAVCQTRGAKEDA